MSKVYFKYFMGVIPFSILIFLAILYPLVSLKNSIAVDSEVKTTEAQVHCLTDKELYNQAFNKVGVECGSYKVNCASLIEQEIKKIKEEQSLQVDNQEEQVAFIAYILDTNYMILFIYFLLIMALNFQFSILVYIWFEKIKNLDNSFFDVSDWAINTPPILGVLGTIISFSILVAQSGDIQQSFSKSFFDAALTTVAGGLIYSINLFLKIFIFKYIGSK